MKKLTLLFFSIVLAWSSTNAQRIVNNPKLSANTATKLTIDRITLSDTSTVFHISASYEPGNWFRFSPQTYIRSNNSQEKLVVKSAAGIVLGKEAYMPPSGKMSFTLSFPPVNAEATLVDLIECEDDNCFKIFDIELSASKMQSIIPAALIGNWFKADGSKDWAVSLMNDKAIYKNQLWNYGTPKTLGKQIIIPIKSSKGNKTLYFEKGINGLYKVGEQLSKMTLMSQKEIENPKYKPEGNGFNTPILKSDSATYMGYFKGYSQKLGYKTGQIFVDNIFTSVQESYLVNIKSDGTFIVKFPMNHPMGIYVRFPAYNETVYCEPGKTVFQYTDLSGSTQKTLFMGESGTLNRELQDINPKVRANYDEITKLSKGLTPAEHKALFEKMEIQKTADLNTYHKLHPLSKKTYQLTELEIKYQFANVKVDYNQYRSIHANKDNPEEKKGIVLDSAYYSFLKSLPIENPLSLISNSYNSLINRIKYADFIYKINPEENSLQAEETLAVMIKNGVVSSEDLQFVTDYINRDKGQNKAEALAAYNAKYPSSKFADFLKQNETVFNSTANEIFSARRSKKLKRVYNLKDGLVSNIMLSQDYSSDLERGFIPFTDKKLAHIKSQLTDPFMYHVIATYNDEVKRKIEQNKSKTGYVVNEVGQSSPDSLFTTIMKKFKGKPVYIDFWATWCGPCRSGIQQIAPLKDEMAKEDVAFVYITNQTSPTETYKNMIADIKGEHFRLSSDEWNILSSKFKISGIPHYVLVDKDGQVVNANLPHMENGEIKKKLRELMK